MNIKGTKVLLRAIELRDNLMLLEIINNPETENMLGGWSFPVSQRIQEDWINNLKNETNSLRCIIDVDENAVGVIMLTNIDYKNGNAEVHIKLAIQNARQKGYGTDALLTITDYAFSELRLKCLYAHINQNNLPSQKLFKKCGFIEEGILRHRLYKKGEYINVLAFSILNTDI